MRAIFISYRRSDTPGEAGRLFDDLVKHFGERAVFMDVSAIDAGRDFRKAIDESIAGCGVLLVVIGPEWLTAVTDHGLRRLDDPTDFVRLETTSALKRDIPVIPVLVRGAKMPRAEQLPQELADLAYRNCVELTHARWRSDVQLLLKALRPLVGETDQFPERKTVATLDSGGPHMGRHEAGSSASGEQNRPNTTPEQHRPDTPPAIGPSPPGGSPAGEQNRSAAQRPSNIDPAALQNLVRELAIYIGPIAEIVVKRAARHCGSIHDLCLQVASEIDSSTEREKFLKAVRR